MKSVITKRKATGTPFNGARGFTMVEMMVAAGLFGLVISGSLGVYIMCQKYWHATSLDIDTSHMAGLAIERQPGKNNSSAGADGSAVLAGN